MENIKETPQSAEYQQEVNEFMKGLSPLERGIIKEFYSIEITPETVRDIVAIINKYDEFQEVYDKFKQLEVKLDIPYSDLRKYVLEATSSQ